MAESRKTGLSIPLFHLEISSHYSKIYGSARLLVWATVCKTAAFALLVQFQPDPLWRDCYWQGKLFAKQSWTCIHCGFNSLSLRLMRTWCNWITSQITNLKSGGSSPSVLALSPGSSVGSSACLKNRRSSVQSGSGGLAHCPIAQWQSKRLLTALL